MKACHFSLETVCLFLIPVILLSCNDSGSNANSSARIPAASGQQKIFDKLIGTWQNRDGKSFERWTKQVNGNYQSKAFVVTGNDTSWNEEADIFREDENWVFENTVIDQNQGKAIRFISKYVNENSVQFTNPSHDFPTDINYRLVDENILEAFIAGPNSKGGKDTIRFHFKRLNPEDPG